MGIVSFNWTKGCKAVEQLPNSIYKIARFPGMEYEQLLRKPEETLDIVQEEEKVIVTCGEEWKHYPEGNTT